MRVLIVGSNGSEHALAWKLAQSPLVTDVCVTPGNAGFKSLGISDIGEIVTWAKSHADLVVVRSDNYLADGLVDRLQDAGVLVFGPTQAAAKIEWSKAYAKAFMQDEGIPTAASRTFVTAADAFVYVRGAPHPLVVKADGLAYGKGVVVSQSVAESEAALQALHGTVVIEEFMQGREISVHALCDGERAVMFPPSQDHKRAGEGNTGPNTGGMGTVTPVPGITDAEMQEIKDRLVMPTLRGLARRGTPFKGLLFPGVMLTAQGPKVIEFNARFGDPETQSYMRLLQSDLLPALVASAKGDISGVELQWREGAAATVILASAGYPGEYRKGLPITIPNLPEDIVVFHSGTKRVGDTLETNGGRVLGVSAVGVDLKDALAEAYSAVEKVTFDGVQYRRDIGTYGTRGV